VRYGTLSGVVQHIEDQRANVLFDNCARTWVDLIDLSRAPLPCTTAEALAFVQTARETGAESIATPIRVLEALANAARGE